MIKNTLHCLLLLSFLILTERTESRAQNCVWAKMGTGSVDDDAVSLVTDASGNIYSAGNFNSPTLTFGSVILIDAASMATNIYVVKHDPSGGVVWAKSFGGSITDKLSSMVIDASGNLFVYGMFESPTITFGTTTLTNISGHDMYIAKLNNAGTVLWAKSERWGPGTTYLNQAIDAATDPSGNVYVTGYFDSSVTIGTYYLPINNSAVSTDVFIAKFDPSGNVLWAKSTKGTGGDNSSSCITTDASGNVYLAGSYSSSNIVFDAITLTSAGVNYNTFLVKYNSAGSAAWAKNVNTVGTTDLVECTAIAADAAGNTYLTGVFDIPTLSIGSTTLTNIDPTDGTDDIFIAKYDASGNPLWAKSAGGGDMDEVYSIALDPFGNAYICGLFTSTSIAFGTKTLSNYGMYIAKYTSSGNPVWAKGAATPSSSGADAIARDASGNIYITGGTDDVSLTLDAITLTNSAPPTVETFTAKYNDPTLGVATTNGSNGNGDITLYPNPAQEKLTINNTEKITHITISNLLGQMVYDHEFDTDKAVVDTKYLAGGVYILRVNNSEVRQFIKQ